MTSINQDIAELPGNAPYRYTDGRPVASNQNVKSKREIGNSINRQGSDIGKRSFMIAINKVACIFKYDGNGDA